MNRYTKQPNVPSLSRKTILGITMVLIFVLQSAGQNRLEGLSYQTHKPVVVEFKNGLISKVKSISRLSNPKDTIYIAPGLIDNQVNGFAGVSFALAGGPLTQEGIEKATRELWKRGVTTYFPTLTTNREEVILTNLRLLALATKQESMLGSIPGFHLEGPYISPVDGYRGAHPLKYVQKPNWSDFERYLAAADNKILTITLAPELEGAIDFIQRATAKGIVVALGHHNATKAVIDEAVVKGARISTHLGNGCANTINRHVNPLWPQLANQQLMASLICDGFHLRDEELKVFFSVKGVDRTIITSDVTGFATLPPGLYKNEEGETIELTPEGMLRLPSQNVLYGSASPLIKGVAHLMQVTGCTLGEAIQMASTNPARLYGLTDRGTLEPGKRADLILFRQTPSALSIVKTFVQGVLVYDAASPNEQPNAQ